MQSKSKGNILKDSFYKERLSRTSNHIIKGYTTQFQSHPDAIESDTDQIVISPEEEQLNCRDHLSNIGKTSDGTTFAFRDFNCTHKQLPAIHKIAEFKFLQRVDLSFNSLNTLKHLNGLKFLTIIKATNNQLTTVLDTKQAPLHLDTLDLSNNRIGNIADLSRHRSLRILKLNGNKITSIKGLNKNKNLRILDLSENVIEEITGLDNLGLRQLYLSNNQIDSGKGLSKLEHLRVLHLAVNKIRKLGGLMNLIALRQLNLAKNNIRHVRQINFLQNLMHLNDLDLSYNPLQERKYYRLQIIYKLPMLKKLDGSELSGEELVMAQSLYGLDVEEKYNIFKKHLPEQEFIDRRIHKSELIEAQTDSQGQNNNLVDEYDQDGRKTFSNSKGSRFNASKRSNFSKGSIKNSKRSSFSKG